MSGSCLTLLVRADEQAAALAAANNTLDNLSEWGYLSEGDKGYVDDDEPVVLGSTHPGLFIEELRNAQDARRNEIAFQLAEIKRYMHGCGITSLDEVTLEEESISDMGMVGYHLVRLGKLISGSFDSECGLYNADTYDGGVSPDEFENIAGDPDGWALVRVIVG